MIKLSRYYHILSRYDELLVLEKKILKIITIYGHGGHFGQVTQLICINFYSHSPVGFHMSFGSKSTEYFSEISLTLKSE